MYSRRKFLGSIGLPAAGISTLASIQPGGIVRALQAAQSIRNTGATPEEVAQTPDDLIEFVIRSADLQFELTEQGKEILSLRSECASLHELAQHLERSQQDFRWYWLDLYFGIRLRYGTASTGTWGASEIWHNALEPWTPWVRAGSIGRSDW